MRLIKETTRIDFLGKTRRQIALAISAIVLLVSLGSLVIQDPPLEFGIDFTGGILIEVGYPEAADLPAIRTKLTDAGFEVNFADRCTPGPPVGGKAQAIITSAQHTTPVISPSGLAR